ncbi:MAG TPA: class I SAM-dependent methyltransferase [Candidatus Acidoferrales bacterium]|nr:class I SAM-dependent methyltransferase [Candidatus Acidoferrales bacterium]
MNYDALAEYYDPQRLGYSNELYSTLLGLGLSPRHYVVDVGSGTGLGSAFLIENGFRVTGLDSSPAMLERARDRIPAATWVEGRAESMPFEAGSFDAAIAAHAFHRFDRQAAIEELIRTVRPGGLVAMWWRTLSGEDPVKLLRDEVASGLGAQPPAEGLANGFKEFYGSRLTQPLLRVVPWLVTMPLADFMRYERSRLSVALALRERAGEYFSELESRLRRHAGERGMLGLSYLQFVYAARTPAR